MFWVANFSMTLLLRSGMSLISFFSMESIARALRRSCVMVFLRKVLILLKVEKHLSYFCTCHWRGDENPPKTASLSERVLSVVLHEKLQQSLEFIILVDQGLLCFQLGFVQHCGVFWSLITHCYQCYWLANWSHARLGSPESGVCSGLVLKMFTNMFYLSMAYRMDYFVVLLQGCCWPFGWMIATDWPKTLASILAPCSQLLCSLRLVGL